MEENIVKILKIEPITHDVKRFVVEKPEGYNFKPGQSAKVSVNQDGWRENKHSFTFTSLNEDSNLEFIIKGYNDHEGLTNKIHNLTTGDELIISEPRGTFAFENSGTFIAGGTGITPFLAQLRQLKKDGELSGYRLIFSNKTAADVIYENELRELFPEEDLILTLTREQKPGYLSERIDKTFLRAHVPEFRQAFYICGPKAMVAELKDTIQQIDPAARPIAYDFGD